MYMTMVEIRALSRRIPAIIDATPEELLFWMDDAFDVINNYCQQDFVDEKQAVKRGRATTNTLVYLPKALSGDVTVADEGGSIIFTSSDASTASSGSFFNPSGGTTAATGGQIVEVFPGSFVIGYYRNNSINRPRTAEVLNVKGDWGYALTADDLLFDGINTLRDLYEIHRLSTVFHNSADTLNPVISPNATDFDSAAIILNELKGVINSHFGDFVVHNIADTNVSTLDDVTDAQSAQILLADLKAKFNSHLKKGGSATTVHPNVDDENTATFSADFAGSVMPRAIRRAFLRIVQRIALRDEAEDHRQLNSPYTTETLGDGYSYDLSNGTLRNLIRPEEAHMLLPFVNRGRVVI